MADVPFAAAFGQVALLAAELDSVRKAGFTEAALAFPRDELALKMLCAFNGQDPIKAPNGWHYFPNAACKKAWQRVADVTREHIEQEYFGE